MEPTGAILHRALPIVPPRWTTPYATNESTTSIISLSYVYLPVGTSGMPEFFLAALHTRFTCTYSDRRFPAEEDLANHQQHCQ